MVRGRLSTEVATRHCGSMYGSSDFKILSGARSPATEEMRELTVPQSH